MKTIMLALMMFAFVSVCSAREGNRYEKIMCPKSSYVVWESYKDGGGRFVPKTDPGYKTALKKKQVTVKKYKKSKKTK